MSQKTDKTLFAWPYWLLRYIASGDDEAFNDIVWSVGGSRPYGDTSYEEASAVYDLLQDYIGQGMASESSYEAVGRYIKDKPERLDALEAFHCHDRIASSPTSYSEQNVVSGIRLGEKIGHKGVWAYFITIQSQLLYKSGEIAQALELINVAIQIYVSFAMNETVYTKRLISVANSLIYFTAIEGDFTLARILLTQFSKMYYTGLLDELRNMLGDTPMFNQNSLLVADKASELLESGYTLQALEWYIEAEHLLTIKEDERQLCGILGDKAVAFRRLGNTHRAIETYQQAIILCRKYNDFLNLSRWNANLGQIFFDRNEHASAEICFKEGMNAAIQTKIADQISVSTANCALLLTTQGRYQEAIHLLDQALSTCPNNQILCDTWTRNKSVFYTKWGSQLRDEGQLKEALEAYTAAINYLNLDNDENKGSVADLYLRITELNDILNDSHASLTSLEKAIQIYRDLGNYEIVTNLENRRSKLKQTQVRLYEKGEKVED